MKTLALVLLASLPLCAQTSYTFAGRDTNPCGSVLSENGVNLQDSSYVCFTASEFTTQPGFSLYLPDLTVEGSNPVTYGPYHCHANNHCTRNDSWSESGYTGTVHELFTRTTSCVRTKYGTHCKYVYHSQGGTGTVAP